MKSKIIEHNRRAWDKEVESGKNPWTQPVSADEIATARTGEWRIVLTPQIAVPRAWFGARFPDCDVLCLASGGGQQAPILAAAGARVTVFDNSPKQLEQDRFVAQRDGLTIRTVQGDAADLGAFADASFDLIVHPVSNIFMPDVRAVWRECRRVLRTGGALLSGISNPIMYIFDAEAEDQRGELIVRHALPYADETHLTREEHARIFGADSPLEFSHSLDDQIGGQLAAGFVLTDFYEDNWAPDSGRAVARYFPCFFATRALKV